MSKLGRTSGSLHYDNPSSARITFQTRYKMRGTNQFAQSMNLTERLNDMQDCDDSSLNNIQSVKSPFQFQQQNDRLSHKNGLMGIFNHSNHYSQKCLCNECLCGRHMCKLHVVKPDLRKGSTYRTNFIRAKSIINPRILHKQQNKSLPKVQMNSTYAFSFKNKEPNYVIKHRPKDQLQFQGPSQNITSYKVNFPGNRGNNPYVSPKQVFVSGQFPYKNRVSSYKSSYSNFGNVKNQSAKINDQLKVGTMNCFKESFYQQKFRTPNPQDYGLRVKSKEKLQSNPDYPHQYESSYEHEFVAIRPTLCPAKIKIQTKYKDVLNNKKNSFNQNSDFKGFSSSYHALSLAPLGQY